MEVRFDPEVAPAEGGRVRVTVAPRDSVADLTSGRILLAGRDDSPLRLKPDGRALTATLTVPPRPDGQEQLPVVVYAQTPDGFELRYVAGLNRVPQPRIALRGVIHSITLERLKANGWRWDADAPDPFCKLYVNDLLVKQTPAVRNQYRFLQETAFDCHAGDRIRIAVWDEDLVHHDFAGEIRFTATPGQTVTQPTTGQLQDCRITVQAVPLRPQLPE